MKASFFTGVVFIFLLFLPSLAQPGLTISGELTDSEGELIGENDSVSLDVVVKIYDEDDGTEPGYVESFLTEESQGITVYNGIFTVQIGISDTTGALKTVLSSAENPWLELTIDGDTLSRSPITSSPYVITYNRPHEIAGN
ncbi:hypothetical protein QA601_07245 [Chitinispirillales bacterium ANBcel5]|uniref:hypothetical protein n=1 Tax=Cellulosispirillum alkaliphilum TaxID=3039283 RepID=UPI002A567DB0|nr:hypothetical protein [Chitinispirillales bacterium ANBcel5]